MHLKKEIKIVIVIIIFSIFFSFLYFSMFSEKDFKPKTMIGKNLPNLSSKTLYSGIEKDLKSISENEKFILNVFASWCVPCKVEHPYLMKLKAQGFKIVAINYKDNPSNAKQFLEKYQNPFQEILLDSKGSLAINLGVFGVPETFIIDNNFKIIDKHIGPINENFFQKVMNIK